MDLMDLIIVEQRLPEHTGLAAGTAAETGFFRWSIIQHY